MMESFFATIEIELELGEARGICTQTSPIVFEWLKVFYT